MKINILRKLESIGGIEKNLHCINDKKQLDDAFLKLETQFNSYLPQSYKEFYSQAGSFSFLELVCTKCIDESPFMIEGNKVTVGDFYCVIGNYQSSTEEVLSTFQEQLPAGLLPICDGELGDVICISLRDSDYESIYYFHHESPPDKDCFLIAKKFDDFIMSLEIYELTEDANDLVKNMKVELSPEFITLLKNSGYQPKE